MASSRTREDVIALRGQTVEELKQELSRHLAHLSCRKHPDVISIQNKVPMGLTGIIEPGQTIEGDFVFPVGGTLQDFVSRIAPSVKDIWISIEVVTEAVTQKVEQRMQDGFRSYRMDLKIPDRTFGTLRIENKGKTSEKVSIGFTYQQGKAYEIKEVEFNGPA